MRLRSPELTFGALSFVMVGILLSKNDGAFPDSVVQDSLPLLVQIVSTVFAAELVVISLLFTQAGPAPMASRQSLSSAVFGIALLVYALMHSMTADYERIKSISFCLLVTGVGVYLGMAYRLLQGLASYADRTAQ